MDWTTPRTWVTSELVTAAFLNTHIRDNLNFVHDTHGPIWVPAIEWAQVAQNGLHGSTDQGADEVSMQVIQMNATNAIYFGATVLLPDDWISGGITWKLHYKKVTAAAGDYVWEIDYGHIATGEDIHAAGANLDKTFTPTDDTNYQIESIGTSVAPSAGDLIRLVVRRDGVEGADTSADTMHFIGMEGEYT